MIENKTTTTLASVFMLITGSLPRVTGVSTPGGG
jgi:hypothetical protein